MISYNQSVACQIDLITNRWIQLLRGAPHKSFDTPPDGIAILWIQATKNLHINVHRYDFPILQVGDILDGLQKLRIKHQVWTNTFTNTNTITNKHITNNNITVALTIFGFYCVIKIF